MKNMLIKLMVVSTTMFLANPVSFVLADQPVETGKRYKLPPNLKKHYSEKYDIKDISSTIQETPDGPKGYLMLDGKIKPSKIDMATLLNEPDVNTHARNMSQAFIDEEADTLGISKKEEVREERIFSEEGHDGPYTMIRYMRYINGLILNNAYIEVTIGPSREIEHFRAELVPTPSKLFEAAQKETLSEAQIIKIIEADLGTQGKDTKNLKVEKISKYLETESPYVFYGVTVKLAGRVGTRMSFKLDAQTGEILASKVIRYTNKGK